MAAHGCEDPFSDEEFVKGARRVPALAGRDGGSTYALLMRLNDDPASAASTAVWTIRVLDQGRLHQARWTRGDIDWHRKQYPFITQWHDYFESIRVAFNEGTVMVRRAGPGLAVVATHEEEGSILEYEFEGLQVVEEAGGSAWSGFIQDLCQEIRDSQTRPKLQEGPALSLLKSAANGAPDSDSPGGAAKKRPVDTNPYAKKEKKRKLAPKKPS